MKTIILCGGLGSRLSEETHAKPKPMVTVGNHPILWHIMKIYSHYGYNQFVLPLGYKGETIKEYFLNYFSLSSDCTVDLSSGMVQRTKKDSVDWLVTMIDTGLNTMTGGRLHRLQSHLQDEETFMLTYGDGVSNVDINALVKFHQSHGKIATVSAVRPTARFGTMRFDGNQVKEFVEKAQTGEGWINGGFFVFNRKIFSYLANDETVLEGDPLSQLAADGQLMAYRHEGFWQCMDTIRDRNLLCQLWDGGHAPWKVWNTQIKKEVERV